MGSPDARDPVTLPWAPLPPATAGALFTSFDAPWWIAGGYALEAFVGQSFRPHEDVDVLVLRRDAGRLHALLGSFELWAADPPGTLRRWDASEPLPERVHDVWCRTRGTALWQLQLMVDESEGSEWVSRHDVRVRRPLETVGWTQDGLFYLAPEVQLFYKARAPRPKDDRDREMVLPRLGWTERAWLREAVTTVYGSASPWYGLL